MKTIVLGGGLTGLTISYLLSLKGIDCEVLEKETQCGGLLRVVQNSGFTFDYGGSHIIFSKDEEVLDFILNLLGENKVMNRRNTKVLYGERYVKYPFENGLSDLSKEENYACIYYFIQNLINKQNDQLKKPLNLKDWCYYTFGKGIAEKYLLPYNKKIWKYPPKKLSLNWVERIPSPSIEDIIKSSLGIQTEGYTHQLYFFYPKIGGIQSISNQLEAKIKNNIKTNFEVKEIRKEAGKWVISNGKETKICDKIISTIPIQNLVAALSSPRDVRTAATNLKYNSIITVMIGLSVQKANDLSWLYIPDKKFLPHRVSFPSNFSSHVMPPSTSSVLAEITCTSKSKIWQMTDEEIQKRVINDLHELKILNKNAVCFSEVKRTKYAYVINDVAYDKNIAVAKHFVKNAGIDLVGRFAEFEYLNMDACVRHAMDYVRVNY